MSSLAIESSGTERVRAESGWHYSLGQAEQECTRNINAEIDRVTRNLRSQGKKVVGAVHYSIRSAERQSGGKTEYKCSATSEINWVSAQVPLDTPHSDRAKSDLLSSDVDLQILEQILLSRFKAKCPGWDTYTLESAVIINADVKVGEKTSTLPSSVAEEKYELVNDTDETQEKTVTLTISTTEGETFTRTKDITTTDSVRFGLSYQIGSLATNGEASRTWDTKIGESSTRTFERNRTYQEVFSQKVGPKKILTITITREVLKNVYKLSGAILFGGSVVVSKSWKDVYACGPFGTGRCSTIKTKTQTIKLEQLLADEERSLSVEGLVTISSSANTQTTSTYTTRDLPDAPPEAGAALLETKYRAGHDYVVRSSE